VTSVFSPNRQSTTLLTAADKKWLLTRQLALMCCTDLLPFNIVEKPGFKRFLSQNNVVQDMGEIPVADTVSRSGLQSVYDETRKGVEDLIRVAPKTVAMTTDLWTDNYMRRSYITFTLHFCSEDFIVQDVVLKTVVFNEAHTGEIIKKGMIGTVT
jgi:hypothetical protein